MDMPAESGRECLDKMKEAAYDMIFLDHQMPEMDGIETRKQMDALEGNKNIGIPVIALTANAVSGAREIYMANGFTDYLTKPIDTVALEKMLVQYIPEEKVILTDADTSSSGESPTEEFSEEKLSWEGLSAIRSMDISFAKLHLPDTELLQKALSDFYQVIDIQAEKLDGMYQAVRKEMEHPGTEQREMEQPGMESFKKKPETEQSDALSAYRIQVHGMKSSAAIIGLTGLSGMARILEFAAQDGKAEKILELHEIFLEKWRDMKEEMRGVWGLGEETDDSSAEEFNQNEVNGLLEVLRTSMEEFDLDRADAVVEKLKEYSYHEDRKEKMSRLYAAVADVDAETADCIIQELMALQ